MNYFVRILLILLFLPFCMAATNFQELDKPPEGVYKGQIFLGGFFSFGLPFGQIIDAENDFVDNSTYSFSEADLTKKITLSHLAFTAGAFSEYMFMDYIGARSSLHVSYIVQRSQFGSDLENKTGTLYKDYALLFGPSFHVTYRKPWDINFHPMIGVAYSTFEATPVAKKLLDNYDPSTKNTYFSLIYGMEVDTTVFFSGGFFLSMGVKWLRNTATLPEPINETNPQTGASYLDGSSSGTIDAIHLVISAGYAYYN